MRSLATKLILAFLLVSLTGIPLVAGLASIITTREFSSFNEERYGELVVNWLAEYYERVGSWRQLERDIRRARLPGGRIPPPEERLFVVVDRSGRVMLPGAGRELNEPVDKARIEKGYPITVDENVVGTLLTLPVLNGENTGSFGNLFSGGPFRPLDRQQQSQFDAMRTNFLRRVNNALLISALFGVLISLAIGVVLSRSLVRPLKEITAATRAVAAGDLAQQVPVRSRDELGELAASFNTMNAALATSYSQRRQMTADIAHELRTPLSIIMGHAEGLADGFMPADRETFEVLVDESQRLSRLIDDLRTLSLADAGTLSIACDAISSQTLLEQAALSWSGQAQQQNVKLVVRGQTALPDVYADGDRIAQVFGNLLSNALRHTPEGGTITLFAKEQVKMVEFNVADSGPGIADEDLPYVFDRLYRSDKARQREAGGSGLGLAIVRSIVAAHGGEIVAANNAGAGAVFSFTLPRSDKNALIPRT